MDDSKPTLQLPPFSGVRGAQDAPDHVQPCLCYATCVCWCTCTPVPGTRWRARCTIATNAMLCKATINAEGHRLQVHTRTLAPSRSCWPRKCPLVRTICVPTMSACTTRWIRLHGATCHSRCLPRLQAMASLHVNQMHQRKGMHALRGIYAAVLMSLLAARLMLAGWHDRCPDTHSSTRDPLLSVTTSKCSTGILAEDIFIRDAADGPARLCSVEPATAIRMLLRALLYCTFSPVPQHWGD